MKHDHRVIIMRFIILFCVYTLISLAPGTAYGEGVNAGFVQGIWYASPTPFAGEPTRIYVALRNNTDTDLTGTIRFTDNGNRIGISYVSALPGRIVEGWIDWTPTYGKHTITASLVDVRAHAVGEDSESVEVASTIAEDTLMVDYDTDRDGVGNETDTDDDGDTLSDAQELSAGTDPLSPNTPAVAVPTRDTRDRETQSQDTLDTALSPKLSKSPAANRPEGLEQFTPSGTVDELLERVTNKVNDTRDAVDAYRKKREDALRTYFRDTESSSTPKRTAISSSTSTPDISELATITRTRIEHDEGGFLTTILGAGKALIQGIYTLILYALSQVLARPAFVELMLLIAILYALYRTARKFGRRPSYTN